MTSAPTEAPAQDVSVGPDRRNRVSEPPNTEDVLFVNHLISAGLLDALDQRELRRIAGHLTGQGRSRRCDLLESYYGANGNTTNSSERRITDRFVGVSADLLTTAQDVVGRIARTNPEIGMLSLERIGAVDGPLVLRARQHVAAIEDDEWETSGDGDSESVEAESEEPDDGRPTVSVHALVRAANRLLHRADVKERLVALAGDEDRELYVGVSLQSALALVREELLDHPSPEAMMEFADW